MSDFAGASFGMYDIRPGTGIEELRKALLAGTEVDPALLVGGGALRVQDLEMTLVNAVFSQDEAKLFKRLKQTTATSTVHEFTRRDEVGADYGGFAEEASASMETDQDLLRVTVPMKTVSTKRKVSLHLLAAQTIDDAKASEKLAGTLTILRRLERALYYGDSAIVPAEFDGLFKTTPSNPDGFSGVAGSVSGNVIDLRGNAISTTEGEAALTEATRIIRGHYGKGDLAMMSLRNMQEIQNLIHDRLIFPVFDMKDKTLGRQIVTNYPTPFGNLELDDDIFLEERTWSRPSLAGVNKPKVMASALAPVVLPAPTPPAGPAASYWAAGDAGNYYYIATYENKWGESDPDTLPSGGGTLAIATAGCVMQITIDAVTGVGSTPTGIRLYRSKIGATATVIEDFRLVGRYPCPDPSTPTVIYDNNINLPDTSDMYILTMDPVYNSLDWAQFLPLLEFTLYPTDEASYPFLIMMVGAMLNKVPTRHVRISNIGYTGGWYS
jgi:hypothetical protein